MKRIKKILNYKIFGVGLPNLGLWILEMATAFAAIAMFHRIFEQQAALSTVAEYEAFSQALGTMFKLSHTQAGGNLLTSIAAYFIAYLGVPLAYMFLVVHRVLKMVAVSDAKRQLKRENKTLVVE